MTDREKLIALLEKDACPLLMVFGENMGGLADYLLANGVTFATDNNVGGKWIPVTERLPEHGEVCECYTVYKGVNMMQWDGVAERWIGERLIYKNDVVTHWRPLPEPPKGG